jgi:hypothetical protein
MSLAMKCPCCGSYVTARHCDSRTCDWFTCGRCSCYGTNDLGKFTHPSTGCSR